MLWHHIVRYLGFKLHVNLVLVLIVDDDLFLGKVFLIRFLVVKIFVHGFVIGEVFLLGVIFCRNIELERIVLFVCFQLEQRGGAAGTGR